MNASFVYGNPKEGGFVHGCLDFIADRLAEKGVMIEKKRLMEKRIEECVGCLNCLRRGVCVHDDDVASMMASLRKADGIVVGASVRNGFFPALFKRFYERITYLIGFTRDLADKPVLAIGAVGMAGGRKNLGRLITLREFATIPTDYLFFRTGIPGRLTVDDVVDDLMGAASRFCERMASPPSPSLTRRISRALDNAVIRRFMLKKNPEGVYDHIIEVWRRKGLLL